MIATDCISEGQNLQDCDWLINYDIHWNPVRIIQRFGRIDRIGSPNERIQLVNFWPNMELEEYINLEQRVSGRMVLLDISATGEENLIEQQSGNQMNDLEYRRKQLLKLQDAVIDLEDLSTGVSIADLTLTDFRIDLAAISQGASGRAGKPAARRLAVTTAGDAEIAPGIIFCLRAEGDAVRAGGRSGLSAGAALSRPCWRRWNGTASLHAGQAGARPAEAGFVSAATCPTPVLAPASTGRPGRARTCAKPRSCSPRPLPPSRARTKNAPWRVCSRRAGPMPCKGEFAGINDFEVVAFLVVLPRDEPHERTRRSLPMWSASDLPASAKVDQRVPKKLLIENGAPTAADKRADQRRRRGTGLGWQR